MRNISFFEGAANTFDIHQRLDTSKRLKNSQFNELLISCRKQAKFNCVAKHQEFGHTRNLWTFSCAKPKKRKIKTPSMVGCIVCRWCCFFVCFGTGAPMHLNFSWACERRVFGWYLKLTNRVEFSHSMNKCDIKSDLLFECAILMSVTRRQHGTKHADCRVSSAQSMTLTNDQMELFLWMSVFVCFIEAVKCFH